MRVSAVAVAVAAVGVKDELAVQEVRGDLTMGVFACSAVVAAGADKQEASNGVDLRGMPEPSEDVVAAAEHKEQDMRLVDQQAQEEVSLAFGQLADCRKAHSADRHNLAVARADVGGRDLNSSCGCAVGAEHCVSLAAILPFREAEVMDHA